MNHDITHCKGVNCKIREQCYRYIAHVDVINVTKQQLHFSYFKNSYPENCKHFWDINKY